MDVCTGERNEREGGNERHSRPRSVQYEGEREDKKRALSQTSSPPSPPLRPFTSRHRTRRCREASAKVF